MTIHSYYFSPQKRIFDLVLGLLLLIFLSPIFVIIALLIVVTAGWPVFFHQQRTGLDGKTFTLFKFRTMVKNATMLKPKYQQLNQAPAPMFKIHDDPRFVGIGRWLARTGLDELPQLWNIIRGEMSFVGPRPLPIAEARALPGDWRSWREKVCPGIFSAWGLAKNKHSSLKNWQALEEKTLQQGSWQSDLKLIAATLIALIKH